MRPKTPRGLLKGAKAHALLVTHPQNIRYLTGVELSSGAVLITRKKMILFADSRYTDAARAAAYRGVTVRNSRALPAALRRVRRCGFEEDSVTVERLGRWKRNFLNTKFVQSSGIIEAFRRTKDEAELRSFRRAQRMTRELLRRVRKYLSPGVSEREVAAKLRFAAFALGADDLAFDPIVAFGRNTSHPHHHPTERRLKKRDIVQIDIGVKVKGYCSDQSAVFFVGAPTHRQRQVFDAVEAAKRAAMRAVKVGVTNHELDRIARSVLKRHKLERYFVHALGHGLGLEVHEGPTLSGRAKKVTLLRNEIVAIEPGVYIPGKFGIRIEGETVVQ